MKNWKTKIGYKIFEVSGGRSKAYLISTEKGTLLVDTGKKSSFNRLVRNISSLNLDRKTIDFLILTHSHYDHCQNANSIKQKYNCKIIMSEKEEGFATLGFTPIPKGTTLLTNLISLAGKKLSQKWFEYTPFTPDILVNDHFDLENLGFSIRLVHTNGHSIGSVSILIDNEIAIVGDEMLGTFRNSIFPPFADDIPGMINSWEKLLKTGCSVFLPGHGNEISRALLQNEYDRFSRKLHHN
jgi:glyoxylase-like metal-dependent hydrolase (beta-lactamase superfamily II)